MIVFRKAVLIIHGFTGSLYENEYLMNYLELDPNYDVYARTLPGHNMDRFSSAKMKDWIEFVSKEIEELIGNGYRSIYVIGHSMGGILATILASKYKEIKKLVLINAAFDYLNFKQNKDDLIDKDTSKYAHLWQKALRTSPIMFNEFRHLVKEGNKYLNLVTCDTLILRSTRDEIIPYKVGDTIYQKISAKEKYLTDIKDASHVVLSGSRKEITSYYIKAFLKGGRRWKKNMQKEI